MLSRPEVHPSDFHQGEYVAHIDGATFRVRRVVGALEQWIATCVSDPGAPPVTGILRQDVEANSPCRLWGEDKMVILVDVFVASHSYGL